MKEQKAVGQVRGERSRIGCMRHRTTDVSPKENTQHSNLRGKEAENDSCIHFIGKNPYSCPFETLFPPQCALAN